MGIIKNKDKASDINYWLVRRTGTLYTVSGNTK